MGTLVAHIPPHSFKRLLDVLQNYEITPRILIPKFEFTLTRFPAYKDLLDFFRSKREAEVTLEIDSICGRTLEDPRVQYIPCSLKTLDELPPVQRLFKYKKKLGTGEIKIVQFPEFLFNQKPKKLVRILPKKIASYETANSPESFEKEKIIPGSLLGRIFCSLKEAEETLSETE